MICCRCLLDSLRFCLPEYKVKWSKGEGLREETTWEPEKNLACHAAIRQFHTSNALQMMECSVDEESAAGAEQDLLASILSVSNAQGIAPLATSNEAQRAAHLPSSSLLPALLFEQKAVQSSKKRKFDAVRNFLPGSLMPAPLENIN